MKIFIKFYPKVYHFRRAQIMNVQLGVSHDGQFASLQPCQVRHTQRNNQKSYTVKSVAQG